MSIRHCGKSWFETSKVVIDDYGPKIGAHGIAVYVCLIRHAEDNKVFEFEDVATMLALEQSEVVEAFERLLNAGVVIRKTLTNNDETTSTEYELIDLAPQYYYGNQSRPPFEAQPKPVIQSIPGKNKPTCKGFVYVVGGGGYFKIGCTTNLFQRIKALTVKAPFTLVVHLVIPSLDMYATEQELHRRFSKKHRRGEWFDLNHDDIEGIRKNYQSLDPAFLTTE